MKLIADAGALARALDSPLEEALRRLLAERIEQLLADTDHEYDLSELARIIIADPGDSVPALEAAAGYQVMTNPAFEWVADHGGWFEAVNVLDDSGQGVILFVPDREGVDTSLLELLRSLGEPADPIPAAGT